MTDTETQLSRLALYSAAATGYAITGYASKVRRRENESFSAAKFAKTVLVGVVAGGIMAARGDDVNPEAYTAASVIAIPIVDEVLNNAIETVDYATGT